MARRAVDVVVATATEKLIMETLERAVPNAAASYQQCVVDLRDPHRRSYRGVAHELREVLRETLDYLAPEAEVMAAKGFTLEKGQTRPTQRQKALHVLTKRKLSDEEKSAPGLAVTMVEETAAKITREAYKRGSKNAHSQTSGPAVHQMKMWVDAVLGELLAIHSQ
jgi:Predicted pPIWI-associating nuclease